MFGSDKLSREEQSELDHNRLKALINSLSDGFLAVDEAGNIEVFNSMALELLNSNSLEGKSLYAVMHLVDKTGRTVDLLSLIRSLKEANHSLVNRDYRLMLGDGSLINIHFSASAVRPVFGSALKNGYVVVFRDITREKNLEEERDEFISVVSHELRNPVAIAEGGVSNAVLLAERNNLAEAIVHSLKASHEQLVFLEELINDLAMLSRADRGKLALTIEPVNIPEVIGALAKDYLPLATSKGLKLTTELDPEAQNVSSSRLYIREILQNFVTNSIKYTEKGGLTIKTEALPGSISLSVKDTGIGIESTDQDKLFGKFFRSEDSRVRQASGTGLGLYVSAKLARLLGGSVSMHSEINRGSTFTVTLPVSAYRPLGPKPNQAVA